MSTPSVPRPVDAHEQRWTDPRLPERFWSKVRMNEATGCWEWTAGLTNGYGYYSMGGTRLGAHRATYLTLVGPIPDGFHLDHLCCVKNCVNPSHLEPVTPRENTIRGYAVARREGRLKTHCAEGHPYSPENTYIKSNGARECRTCKNAWQNIWRARQREIATPRQAALLGVLDLHVERSTQDAAAAAGVSARSAAVVLLRMRERGWLASTHAPHLVCWRLTPDGALVRDAALDALPALTETTAEKEKRDGA